MGILIYSLILALISLRFAVYGKQSFAVDLIFPFENDHAYESHLSLWRDTLLGGGFHSILMFENHTDALNFKSPSWLQNFEVYSLQGLNHTLCTHPYSNRELSTGRILYENHDGFDVSGALKNLGRWVSNNENVYFVDTKSQPVKESTFHLPYHLHYLATLAYLNHSLVRYKSSDEQMLLSKSFNTENRVETALTFASERLPMGPLRAGVLGSPSLANIAVSSRLCRSTLIFLPSSLIAKLASNENEVNITPRFTDMLSFALLKVSADYGRIALTNVRGGKCARDDLLDAELAAVTSWPAVTTSVKPTTFQRIYQSITSFLPNKNLSTSWHSEEVSYCLGKWLTSECFFYDLVMNLEQLTPQIDAEHRPYMQKLVGLLKTWMVLWNDRHSYLSLLHPRALHSSLFLPGKSGNVALITISHNEKQLLPIWYRYYSRHFNASDIFIYDHKTSDGSIEAKVKKYVNGFHFLKMQGTDANYLMPVRFRSLFIRSQVDMLLRAGYHSVLFTDVDELEPPLNWSRSVLAQRGFYVRDRTYDKPLLVKVPISWRPGFHKLASAKRDKVVPRDEQDVVMFHLRSMDFNFCHSREESKGNMTMGMDPTELSAGFANHWQMNKNRGRNNVELCRYANCGFHGVLTNKTVFVENTGTIQISVLSSSWLMVDM